MRSTQMECCSKVVLVLTTLVLLLTSVLRSGLMSKSVLPAFDVAKVSLRGDEDLSIAIRLKGSTVDGQQQGNKTSSQGSIELVKDGQPVTANDLPTTGMDKGTATTEKLPEGSGPGGGTGDAGLEGNKAVSESESAGDSKKCATMEDLLDGQWTNGEWVPKNCGVKRITKDQAALNECLGDKKVGFYGDSTLRNMAVLLMKTSSGTNPQIDTWAKGPRYNCGGVTTTMGGRFDMWWTPSAYYQSAPGVGQMGTDDVSVLSISVWDMGQYYRGVNAWYSKMVKIIKNAAMARKGKPLFVYNVHALHNSKCHIVHETAEGHRNFEKCKNCNSVDANLAFRDALESAVACAQTENLPVVLLDSFQITNNEFAESESDGVHYEETVTLMELELLVQSVCNTAMMLKPIKPSKQCPQGVPNFEAGRSLNCH